MAVGLDQDDDWDLGEGLDPEGPSGADLDRFGDELMRCTSCGATMYDQASVCPECGAYVVEGEKGLSVWVVIGVLGMVGMLLWMVL